LTQAGNLTGLAAINRELIARAETLAPSQRVVLDLDSTEIPVYGQQELSAYNGHFLSTCYHPLLLFNRPGDCLAARLRPGNVHSAEDWEGCSCRRSSDSRSRARTLSCVPTPPSPSRICTGPWRSGASYRDAVKAYRPMARIGSVNDVADAAEYFASDLSSFISGQHLLLSGGADR